MSLLQPLKRVPPHNKLACKIALMKVVSDYEQSATPNLVGSSLSPNVPWPNEPPHSVGSRSSTSSFGDMTWPSEHQAQAQTSSHSVSYDVGSTMYQYNYTQLES